MQNLPYLIIIIFAVLIRIPFLNREFVLEEALNVKDALAIAQTGYPQVYAGEQAPKYIHLDRPPGLFFFEAAAAKFLPVTEITARSVPEFFFIGQILLIIYYIPRLFPKMSKFALTTTLILFVSHPYLIQNSLHIHYDGAVFSFFSTWFLFAAVFKIINRKDTWLDHTKLAIPLLFSLFVKYDPTLMMLSAVTLFSLIFWRQFLPKFLLTSLITISLFLGIFWLYNNFFGHPEFFLQPFSWILQVVGQRAGSLSPSSNNLVSSWANNYYLAIRFLSWLTIPTILLAATSLIMIFKNRTHFSPQIIFLIFWLSFLTLPYLALGWPGDFPRYFAPAMPALFLLIGYFLDIQIFKKKPSLSMILLTIIIAAAAAISLTKLDLLFLNRISGWIPHLQTPFFILLTGGLFLIVFVNFTKPKFKTLLALTLLFLNFYQIATSVIHDVKSNYSLTNFYGYGDYRDAGLFLKNHLKDKNVIILTFDPVAYYWQGKYLDYNLFGTRNTNIDPSLIVQYLKDDKISAIALPNLYLDDLTLQTQNTLDFQKYLTEKFKNHRNFGKDKGIEVYY